MKHEKELFIKIMWLVGFMFCLYLGSCQSNSDIDDIVVCQNSIEYQVTCSDCEFHYYFDGNRYHDSQSIKGDTISIDEIRVNYDGDIGYEVDMYAPGISVFMYLDDELFHSIIYLEKDYFYFNKQNDCEL